MRVLELDERKEKILKAIIQTYLETGEPVGSRTISKYSDLKLSSATIRNEMSDLEELGYIIQPHTSAGRIPSDKGYRFYVDQIIKEKDSQVEHMQELMIQRVDRVELLLKQLAKVLANNTNYATLISGPSYNQTKLKFIQLSKVEEHKLLVVVVVEGNIIRNSFVTIDEELSDEELLNLNILLNSSLNGLTIEEINLGVIAKMKEQAGSHRRVVDLVLNEVSEVIRSQDEDLQIYTSGATNIFKYPELCALGTRIFFHLLIGRKNRFSCNHPAAAFASTNTDRKIRRADAWIFIRPETVLYDSIFQGMERNDRKPSARCQALNHRIDRIFQHIQFPV